MRIRMAKKKRNATDATIRNVRGGVARFYKLKTELSRRIRRIEARLKKIEGK